MNNNQLTAAAREKALTENLDAVLHQLRVLETAARRYAEGNDHSPSYLLKICANSKSIANVAESAIEMEHCDE